MIRINTDDIKRAVEGCTFNGGPVHEMIRGQSVTIYSEQDGWNRLIGHRDDGQVSWVGYWFKEESDKTGLEAILTDLPSYSMSDMQAGGTHFYYASGLDKVKVVLGMETLSLGIKPVGIAESLEDFNIFDEPGGIPLPMPSFKPAKRIQLKLTRQQVLWSRLSDGAKEIYRKEVKKLWDAVNVPARWEQKSRGLYLGYTHRMDRISDADQPIYIELLRAEFKDSCDHVCIYSKQIVLEVSFNGGN